MVLFKKLHSTLFRKKSYNHLIFINYIAIILIFGILIPTIYSQDEIEWNATININSSDGVSDTVVFGETQNSNDGIPPDSQDIPKTILPIEPYVRAWFDDNLPIPYDNNKRTEIKRHIKRIIEDKKKIHKKIRDLSIKYSIG